MWRVSVLTIGISHTPSARALLFSPARTHLPPDSSPVKSTCGSILVEASSESPAVADQLSIPAELCIGSGAGKELSCQPRTKGCVSRREAPVVVSDLA